ncbi:hypothetical protein D3C80_1964980 [compost metagenome]
MFMATAKHVARHQVPLSGGNVEPTQCQRLILGDALPVQQDLPEQGLGLEFAFPG